MTPTSDFKIFMRNTIDDVIEEPIGNWQSALPEEPLANLIIE